MHQRYSVFFSNLALLVFPFAMFSTNVPVALVASALAFVGWLHGLFAAVRAGRWGWAGAMLGAGGLFLLAWVQTTIPQVQLGFLHMSFRVPADAPVFLLVLPGYLLAPTVLYAIVPRGYVPSQRAVVGSLDAPSANTRRSLAMGSTHPEILSGGLILLGLFLILASFRFGGGGMTVQIYF